MELDVSLLLVGVCIVFALGWLAAKFDIRQLKISNKNNPQSFFKGLTLLLNEQQDQAIDAFIEAVKNDPEAIELYFSLGSLFRRRGEHDNAVKIHQHLLDRADISKADRQRASYALGLDYLNAGILDKAEEMFKTVVGQDYYRLALLALLSIYERSQEWHNAIEITKQLVEIGERQVVNRQAHYECEQAEILIQTKQFEQAVALLQRAAKQIPLNSRIQISLGKLLCQQANYQLAYLHFQQAYNNNSKLLGLFVVDFMVVAKQLGKEKQLLELIVHEYLAYKTVDLAEVILANLPAIEQQREQLIFTKLQLKPSLIVVQQLLDQSRFSDEKYFKYVHASLARNVHYLKNYRCQVCNFESQEYFWHCPGCQSWDSYLPYRIEDLN